MARGHNDYGVPDYSFFAVETPVSDIIAERQGFSRLDNRGRVLWFDDFRNGLTRWREDAGGAGVVPEHGYHIVNAIGYHGSCRLDPWDNGGSSILYNMLALPVSRRMGIEVCLFPVTNHGRMSINMQHALTDGTMQTGEIYIESGTGDIYVRELGQVTRVVSMGSSAYVVNRWFSIKFVLDFDTDKYVRLMVGNTQYDLSAYSLYNGLTGFSGTTYFKVTNEGRTAVQKEECDLGYAVVSGDEP